MSRLRHRLLPVLLALVLAACAADAVDPTTSPSADAPTPQATTSAEPSAAIGEVEPAPGSSSRIYPPNPSEIVVAIEAGHGGCLDWGVPDPDGRNHEFSEKAITMSIARALAALLAADGVTPLLVRDGDESLAGDLYPPLGCDGEPFRDVNGDGMAGFGPEVPEATRTRDELQARIDRANLVGADVLVSLHVDSITDAAGNLLAIARTETFYTDETPWGVPSSQRLAEAIQGALVPAMEAAAGYDRQDRGANAHNLYMVAPPLFEATPERSDRLRQPTRGALMPAVLVEVGTITLPAEHELLLSEEGAATAAGAIFDGLMAWFADRELAGRIAPVDEDAGTPPIAVPGEGPPFVARPLDDGPLRLRITNTGTRAWRAGARIIGGWQTSDAPYLYLPPDDVAPLGPALPALDPGASVTVEISPPAGLGEGGLAWLSLLVGDEILADRGSPALQRSSGAP